MLTEHALTDEREKIGNLQEGAVDLAEAETFAKWEKESSRRKKKREKPDSTAGSGGKKRGKADCSDL